MVDAVVFKKPCKGGCGMDLYWNQLPGTERDEAKRNDYCDDCLLVFHATEDLAESIARWVGANAENESRFLTPALSWHVDATALLDHVADATGVSKEQLGRWAAEELQA